MGLTEIVNSRERLKLITLEHSIESDGNFIDEPVVELFARDEHGERRFIKVEGFYPSFYVTEEEFLDKQADILQESMVRSVEVRDAILDEKTRLNGSVEPQEDAPRERLDNTKLVKIYTVKPSQVKKLRDFFDWHGEADVFFTNHFLVESDIHRGFTIPAGEDRVHIDEIEPVSEDEVPDVAPRMHTVDIEVWSGGEFPDTTNPTKPVTAITAHDSYEDSYFCGVLSPESVVEGAPNSWGKDLDWEYPDGISDDQISVEVYENENELLADYFEYVSRTDPDLMTGWNCMPSGTEITMASGETKVIEDVEIGDTVVGIEDGNTVTTQVTEEYISQKEEFTIETEFGCVKSSKDHRFLTVEDDELTYRRLENLEEGDFVVKPRKYNTSEEVPLLSELVPLERQQFSNEDVISEWRSEQDRGYRVEAAEMFDSTPGYMGRDGAWNPERIKAFSGSIPSNCELRYARTDISLDREISSEEMYKAGLIASDGHMSEEDSRISFYNTEDVLHSVFDGRIYDHGEYKDQRVLNMAMAHTFNGLGIPFGDKSNKGMELSTIYKMPEEYISQFLAGFIDGDGYVSNGSINIAIKSDKTKSWIQKLFSRLGITSSISNDGLYVHKSGLNLNTLPSVLSHMRLDRKVEKVGKNFRGGGKSSKIPEQLFESDPRTESQSRYNGTFTRDSSEVIEYNELQFVEIQSITSSGRSTMHDISTTANSFIAEGFAVHNCSRNDIGSGFDYPYLINRADAINEWSYQDITYDGGRIFVTNRGAPAVGGREMFDMLQAYKKTQIHEKRSYSLEYIAQEELGQGKEDIADLDEGWLHNPVQFIKYNIRDVTAVVQIEQAQEVLSLYDNIRSVAGCTYSEAADSNIGIIDVLFLRQARSRGIALPTSMKPERGWYYGAKVFNPHPGKHRNVVYPDLASLYPYLMWSLNVSPETIYESLAAVREDGYSEDDVYKAYIDYRADSEKRNSDPEPETIYYLKPEVKTGFVRDVVDDMVDMKYEYKGAGKKYDAVKRITNSLYGVFGDSNSYGKGFRLFDWRLAETITIAGRKVLEHTASEFTRQLDAMGYKDAQLIGGDTDSVISTIPNAADMDETLDASFNAADAVNASYDEFMCDTFNICDPSGHKMEVEIESYADAIFFLQDLKSDDPTDGVKKKYSQTIVWDEGDIIENPEPKSKGFKLVRSDTASVTAEVQTGVLHRILEEDEPKEAVQAYLKEKYDAVLDGVAEPENVGIPSSISSDPMDYGWSEDDDTGEIKYFTPQPHIRGARYATAYIDGEDINSGSKPLMFYVTGVSANSDLPETYDYEDRFELNAPKDTPDANRREMKELDREVDAIAVEDVRNIPDEIEIDWEKMAEKTIEDAVNNIAVTMGWDFSDLVSDGSQAGLADFM